VVAQRADSFLEAGDMAGSAVWCRVLKAIKEIREEPEEGEAVNLPLWEVRADVQDHLAEWPNLANCCPSGPNASRWAIGIDGSVSLT